MHRLAGLLARVRKDAASVRLEGQSCRGNASLALPYLLPRSEECGSIQQEATSSAKSPVDTPRTEFSPTYFNSVHKQLVNRHPNSVLHQFRQAIERRNVTALNIAYAELRSVALQLKDPSHASSHTQAQALSDLKVEDIRQAMKVALYAATHLFRPHKSAKSREEHHSRHRLDGLLALRMFKDMTAIFGFSPDSNDCRRSVLGKALVYHRVKEVLDHFVKLRSVFEVYCNSSDYDDESIVIMQRCLYDDDGVRATKRFRSLLSKANVKLNAVARDIYLHLLIEKGEVEEAKWIAQNDSDGASMFPLAQQDTSSLTKFIRRLARVGQGDWHMAVQMADEVLERARKDKGLVSHADWKGLLVYTGIVKGPAATLELAKDASRDGLFKADDETFTLLLMSHEGQLRDLARGGTEEDVMRLFARIEESCHITAPSASYTVAMRALLGLRVPSLLFREAHKLGLQRMNTKIAVEGELEDTLDVRPPSSRNSVPRYTPGQIHEASLLYHRLKACGLQPDDALVSPLLVAYTSSYIPQLDKALELYRDWRSYGEKLEPKAYNILLLACAKARNIKITQQILHDMIHQGILLSRRALTDLVVLMMEASYSYEAAYEIYCRVRDAAEQLSECAPSGNAPKRAIFDEEGWITIIDRYTKLQLSQESLPPAGIVLEMLNEMRTCGFAPEPKQFTSLLRLYGRSATHALQQLQHLDTRDNIGRNAIFSKVQEMREAIDDVHNYLRKEEKIEPDLILITALMDGYNRVNRSQNALEIWHRLQLSKVVVDSACIAVILDTCGRAGLLQESRRVWEWVQRSEVQWEHCNKGVWDTWVECLARCGRLLEAIDTVFVEMQPALVNRGKGEKADAKTMEMLLRFASAEQKRWNRKSTEEYYLLGHIEKRMQAEMPEVWIQVKGDPISL